MKLKKFVTRVLAAGITIGIIGTTQAMAVSKSYTGSSAVTLTAGKTAVYSASKTTNTDKIGWKLKNVYPVDSSKKDTYSRIKISAIFQGSIIMEERVIYEGDNTIHDYSRKRDLNKKDIYGVRMRGNNPDLSAKADIVIDFY